MAYFGNKFSNQTSTLFFFQIEEDLTSLQKKHSNLENEFDTVNEKYQECQTKMEEAEKTASEVSRRRLWRHLSIFGGLW